jgi:hypothetical protein
VDLKVVLLSVMGSVVLLIGYMHVLPGRAQEDSSEVGHMEWTFAGIEEKNKAQIGKD